MSRSTIATLTLFAMALALAFLRAAASLDARPDEEPSHGGAGFEHHMHHVQATSASRPKRNRKRDCRSFLVGRRHFGALRREYKHDAQASESDQKLLTPLRVVLVGPARVAMSI